MRAASSILGQIGAKDLAPLQVLAKRRSHADTLATAIRARFQHFFDYRRRLIRMNLLSHRE
jgi:hypothetical protein